MHATEKSDYCNCTKLPKNSFVAEIRKFENEMWVCDDVDDNITWVFHFEMFRILLNA